MTYHYEMLPLSAGVRSLCLQGSSTALVMVLEADTLHTANVGDSGFMVVRNGQALFQSPSQQKRFNFPYQLACGDMGDPPSCAEVRGCTAMEQLTSACPGGHAA